GVVGARHIFQTAGRAEVDIRGHNLQVVAVTEIVGSFGQHHENVGVGGEILPVNIGGPSHIQRINPPPLLNAVGRGVGKDGLITGLARTGDVVIAHIEHAGVGGQVNGFIGADDLRLPQTLGFIERPGAGLVVADVNVKRVR